MDNNVFIAIVAALVNLLLSVLVPCALKNRDISYLADVKKMFNQNRELLVTSSVLVGVIVYLSLVAAPTVRAELPEPLLNLMSLGRGTA
jgi:hypothetical protein